jgi:hypothetical protein
MSRRSHLTPSVSDYHSRSLRDLSWLEDTKMQPKPALFPSYLGQMALGTVSRISSWDEAFYVVLIPGLISRNLAAVEARRALEKGKVLGESGLDDTVRYEVFV